MSNESAEREQDSLPDAETVTAETVTAERSGPFAVAPVDPIVFKKTTDSPELRAAAAYVPIARREIRRTPSAPEAPRAQDHTAWTPAGEATQDSDGTPPNQTGQNRVKVISTILAVTVPIALILGAITFGISLLS